GFGRGLHCLAISSEQIARTIPIGRSRAAITSCAARSLASASSTTTEALDSRLLNIASEPVTLLGSRSQTTTLGIRARLPYSLGMGGRLVTYIADWPRM